MKPLEITRSEDAFVPDDGLDDLVTRRGGAEARAVSAPGFSLWLVEWHLDAGAELTWTGRGGDQGLFVREGSVSIDGKPVGTGTAAIFEAGSRAVVVALEPAVLVHVGPRAADNARGSRRGDVHIVGGEGLFTFQDGDRDSRWFADSSCDGCSITLFYTSRAKQYENAAHSHSQDELIHVLHGELNIGRQKVLPGDTVAIRGGTRYRFRSGPDGFGFLNYRPALSMVTRAGEAPRFEGPHHNKGYQKTTSQK